MTKGILAVLLLSLSITGCQLLPASAPTLPVVTPQIEIIETGGGYTVIRETVTQNNCGGRANATQRKKRSFTVSIEGVVVVGMQEPVTAQLIMHYTQQGGIEQEQELVAPPGTNMEYVIDWTEKAYIGFVAVPGQTEQASYAFRDIVAVSLASSRDFGCSSTPHETPSNTGPTGTLTCLTYADLGILGSVIQRLESPPGTLAGAQIAFSQDWVAPAGWVIHKDNASVTSVMAGDVASVWSPDACRPLAGQPNPTSGPHDSIVEPSITGERLSELFGTGNWFCYPDRLDEVGARRLPTSFLVSTPLAYVDTYVGRFESGERVSVSTGANVQLEAALSRNECPTTQQQALQDWDAASRSSPFAFTRANLDSIFGRGNWSCLSDYAFGVRVQALPHDLAITFPFTNVDYADNNKYGVGDTVSRGGIATVWMAGSLSTDQCP